MSFAPLFRGDIVPGTAGQATYAAGVVEAPIGSATPAAAAGSAGADVRPRPAGPGTADQAGRRLAGRAPCRQGRRRADRGRPPVHVPAGGARRRGPDGHLGAARPAPRGRPVPAGVLRARRRQDLTRPTRSTDRSRSMSPQQTFVIVGAGLAGAKAAETLRAEGGLAGGRVVAGMNVNVW